MLRGVALEERSPLTEPRAYRGRISIVTAWFCATNGLRVWCNSAIQMDAAMLLDFDPDIECFQSGVAELRWEEGGRSGAVRPAFFARTRGGQRLAIVHPPTARTAVAEEQVVREAAKAAGWHIRPLQVPQGVLRSSLRCVAHFRAAEFAPDSDARKALLKKFATPQPLQAGAAASGLGLQATGHAWHLLWMGKLTCDWTKPLLPTSLVWASSTKSARQVDR